MFEDERTPHLRQRETDELYDAARELIGDCTLVIAGWESEDVASYLERPGAAVADDLDAVVAGEKSGYWPALDKERAAFWFGSAEGYRNGDRFQLSVPAVDGSARYDVYGDFADGGREHQDRLSELSLESGGSGFRQASALPRKL